MSADANSVNIKSPERGYHHGDLRSALIEEGLRMLEMAAVDAISLREVARNVGVSAPAVYRHFPDKAAFLKALAKEGLIRLGKEQGAVATGAPADAFAASGRAYVRFALSNPGLFRLIFTSRAGAPPNLGSDPEGSAGWQLHRHIDEAMGTRGSDADRRVLAYRAWSLVHGLAMLILDHQIDEAEGITLLDSIVSVDSINL